MNHTGTLIQHLLNRSRLSIISIKIGKATKGYVVASSVKNGRANINRRSFHVAIQSQIGSVGPIPMTVRPEVLDLTFDGVPFGQLQLPEIRMSRRDTSVTVEGQHIQITDMAVFHALVRSIVVRRTTCLGLENGECDIDFMGIVAHCACGIEVSIQGIMGPKATLERISREGRSINLSLEFHNPGSVSIDHGWCLLELRNDEGTVLADLEGPLNLGMGRFEVCLRGYLMKGVEVGKQARLVAIGTECKT